MSQYKNNDDHWDLEIKPSSGIFHLNLKELIKYKDLIRMLIHRDFVAFYKQTILGPTWFFIQPLLTTVMYFLIFHRVANLSTDGIPPILFYLSGVTCWNYFSEVLLRTSDTFIINSNVFGKVYFPRLAIPVSVVFSNLIRLGIQLLLFIIIWIYFYSTTNLVHPQWATLLLLPFILVLMAALSLGLGIIFSSLTTRYRDMRFLLTFGVQLLMFATPIVYPLSLASEKFRFLFVMNPLTAIVETFRYGFLGQGSFSWLYLLISTIIMTFILLIGIILFNKVEKTFIDTV